VPFVPTLLHVLALIAKAIRLWAFIDLIQNSSFKFLTNLLYSVIIISKHLSQRNTKGSSETRAAFFLSI
jgi:hypothetical protein